MERAKETGPMPSDMEQKAKELLDGIESGTLAHLLLAIATAVDAAAEKRTAERCAELLGRPASVPPSPDERYSQGWFAAKKDYAAAIRAEFLGGSKP